MTRNGPSVVYVCASCGMRYGSPIGLNTVRFGSTQLTAFCGGFDCLMSYIMAQDEAAKARRARLVRNALPLSSIGMVPTNDLHARVPSASPSTEGEEMSPATRRLAQCLNQLILDLKARVPGHIPVETKTSDGGLLQGTLTVRPDGGVVVRLTGSPTPDDDTSGGACLVQNDAVRTP